MRLEEEIDIINNKKRLVWLNVGSIVLLIAIVFLYVMLGIPLEVSFNFSSLMLFTAVLVASLLLHEGIHGLFFWLFNKQTKVKFGFKQGMLYATSPGSFYTKGKFLIIGLSPFVILSIIYLIMSRYYPNGALLLFACHTSGCIGDFYYAYLLAKKPKGLLVEDTEKGIKFFFPE